MENKDITEENQPMHYSKVSKVFMGIYDATDEDMEFISELTKLAPFAQAMNAAADKIIDTYKSAVLSLDCREYKGLRTVWVVVQVKTSPKATNEARNKCMDAFLIDLIGEYPFLNIREEFVAGISL